MAERRDSRDLKEALADYDEQKAKERHEIHVGSLRQVLATAAGRLVLFALLDRASVFSSIWDASAKIHYNAGRQDFGHELMADALQADEQAYTTMLVEAKKRSLDEKSAREREEEKLRRKLE